MCALRVVTWNVNSIRTRLPRLLAILKRHDPDIVCLQETKVVDDSFPFSDIENAGYYAAVHGQKAYNGVAVLTKQKPLNIVCSMKDETEDKQARLLAVTSSNVRVLSIYVPNGGEIGSVKWEYKLEWFERMRKYLEIHENPARPLVVCGDFNIASDDKDVHNVDKWKNSVLCHPVARAAFKRLTDWGLVDAFRVRHPEGGVYSWWDYRMLGFPKNDGLRIDGILATKPLVERINNAFIDREERKGKQPSDHAPVFVDFKN